MRFLLFNFTLRLKDVRLDFDVRFLNPHSISFRANVFESRFINFAARILYIRKATQEIIVQMRSFCFALDATIIKGILVQFNP